MRRPRDAASVAAKPECFFAVVVSDRSFVSPLLLSSRLFLRDSNLLRLAGALARMRPPLGGIRFLHRAVFFSHIIFICFDAQDRF